MIAQETINDLEKRVESLKKQTKEMRLKQLHAERKANGILDEAKIAAEKVRSAANSELVLVLSDLEKATTTLDYLRRLSKISERNITKTSDKGA